MKRYSTTLHFSIMAFFFLAFGIALIVATVVFFKDYKHDKANCTEKVKALVVDYEYDPPEDEDEEGTYRPVIEYKIDGKTYKKILKNYSKKPSEGNYITIYYNPNNPEEIFFKENTGLIIAPIGSTVFTIAGIILTCLAIREFKKTKKSLQYS